MIIAARRIAKHRRGDVRFAAWPLLWAMLLACGCVQVDLKVTLHPNDGGATVTETVRASRMAIEACKSEQERGELLSHLKRAGAESRMKDMGEGLTLASHQMRKLPGGGRESVAVYKIAELNKLRIPNPSVDLWPMAKQVSFSTYRAKARHREVPHVALRVDTDVEDVRYKGDLTKKAKTPRDRQGLRELQPIVLDMLEDFQLSLRVEVPTYFTGGRVRGLTESPKTATLFSVSGKNGDRRGHGFFANEEIMVGLLEMDRESGAVIHNSKGAWKSNYGVPVLRDNRFRGFTFYPTKYYADKHLGGRMPPK